MKLKEVKIQNFRGFKSETSVSIDGITAFIGRNDAGKSTILEALGIFFGEVELDCDDAHVTGNKKNVGITCVFNDLPDSLILDSKEPTSLGAEYLLNKDGFLEINKTFNCAGAKPKLVGVYAVANHPKNVGISDLHHSNNEDLKTKLAELKIDSEGVDLRKNPQIRRRIWERTADLKCEVQKIKIDAGEEKGVNDIWDELQAYLPAFALFKSDRSSTDQDDEAQNPMSAAIKEAIKSQETALAAVTKEVEKQVQIIAETTIEKMREMNPALANVLKPAVKTKKWDSLFSVSLSGDEDVQINKRGSGFRRLILLNFFRARAEKRMDDENLSSVIYAFEEPETSQHPNNQRMLMKALLELSQQRGCQVLLSTHTPALGDLLPVESVRFIEVKEDGTRVVHVGDKTTYDLVTKALGILPDNRIKVFVAVEGINDIDFLCGISSILSKTDNTVPDLAKMENDGTLLFIPLGGGNLKLWATRLEGLNRPEFHLYDKDEGDQTVQHQVAVDLVNARSGCKALLTGKREMENYLHAGAVNDALNITVSITDIADVPTLVAQELHLINGSTTPWDALTPEKQKSKVDRAKKRLNREVVMKMTPERVAESDVSGEIKGWLTAIKGMAA